MLFDALSTGNGPAQKAVIRKQADLLHYPFTDIIYGPSTLQAIHISDIGRSSATSLTEEIHELKHF